MINGSHESRKETDVKHKKYKLIPGLTAFFFVFAVCILLYLLRSSYLEIENLTNTINSSKKEAKKFQDEKKYLLQELIKKHILEIDVFEFLDKFDNYPESYRAFRNFATNKNPAVFSQIKQNDLQNLLTKSLNRNNKFAYCLGLIQAYRIAPKTTINTPQPIAEIFSKKLQEEIGKVSNNAKQELGEAQKKLEKTQREIEILLKNAKNTQSSKSKTLEEYQRTAQELAEISRTFKEKLEFVQFERETLQELLDEQIENVNVFEFLDKFDNYPLTYRAFKKYTKNRDIGNFDNIKERDMRNLLEKILNSNNRFVYCLGIIQAHRRLGYKKAITDNLSEKITQIKSEIVKKVDGLKENFASKEEFNARIDGLENQLTTLDNKKLDLKSKLVIFLPAVTKIIDKVDRFKANFASKEKFDNIKNQLDNITAKINELKTAITEK